MPGHLAPVCPDQVWAIDVVSDQTADGRPLKILAITDEHTREHSPPQQADSQSGHATSCPDELTSSSKCDSHSMQTYS
jgi:hypothetical protein